MGESHLGATMRKSREEKKKKHVTIQRVLASESTMEKIREEGELERYTLSSRVWIGIVQYALIF